jgi:hypothetical protein
MIQNRSERLLFIAAAFYNLAWVAFLLVWPEKILPRMPPLLTPMIAMIGLVGLAFAVCAFRRRRWLVGLGILAKLGGPPSFVVAALLGYLAWSQWWLTVINDVIWLPPLIAVWRREARP